MTSNASAYDGAEIGDPSSPPIIHMAPAMTIQSSAGSLAAAGNGSTLSPPHLARVISASPQSGSEMSNEAVGGHSGISIGQSFSPFAAPPPSSTHPSLNNTSNPPVIGSTQSRVVRGGFEHPQDRSPQSQPQITDSGEIEGQISPAAYLERGNGITAHNNAAGTSVGHSIASTSATAVAGSSSDNNNNGFSTHPSTSQSTTGLSQMAGTTNSAGLFEELIPTTFDEATLRTLCDMDVGMPLLYDRIKQSMLSANQASTFFKKRAAIEEEYARNMSKLARSTADSYGTSDAKAGTYVQTWQSFMRTHEVLGDSRLRFAQKLSEISDELANLSKEVDKNRKYAKETGARLERNLIDAESSVEKARHRFDTAAEDLERLLLLKSGESTKGGELQGTSSSNGPPGKRTLGKAIGKGGMLFKNKNPQQILRQEEEIRNKTSTSSDAFRREVLATQGIRQEYFNLQLPRILRSLKESSEEIDNGLQYHLARYAFLFESVMLSDAMAITPVTTVDGSVGLKAAVESIDNRSDFKTYLQNYALVHGRDYRGPKREGPFEEGFVPGAGTGATGAGAATGTAGSANAAPTSAASTRPIFGVALADQMARDMVEVPPILEKCAEAIEAVGLENMGIYRLSGTTSKVQKLKGKFDADWRAVDLMNDEAINDINIIAGCLKLWFRELPEPLMTWDLYQGFIDAARIDNDRMRHIRMHERVNDLPDANYATLKYLMGHLDKIKQQEASNQMSASNLAIVFGPTLLGAPPSTQNAASDGLEDMSSQCLVIQVILERYEAIFVDET